MSSSIPRRSCRIARRADQQGACLHEGNQSEDDKFATGITMDEFVEKCQNKRCKTYPILSTSPYIESNESKRVTLSLILQVLKFHVVPKMSSTR